MRTNQPIEFLQHIFPHTEDCPACHAMQVEELRTKDITKLKFKEAAEVVLEDERKEMESSEVLLTDECRRIGKRTYKDHKDFKRRLDVFFGEFTLNKIKVAHLRGYQLHRLGFRTNENGDQCQVEGAGPTLINHEVAFLAKVLEYAGLWKDLKPSYKRLKERKSEKGRALTEEEEQRLIAFAARKPRWCVMYWGTLLQLNTGAGPGEICHLRVKDFDRKERLLRIREGDGVLELYADGARRRTKTESRIRDIPLNDTAMWACEQYLARYLKFCKRRKIEPSPDHYLLTSRGRNRPSDPTRPFGSWQKTWKQLCEAAQVQGVHRYLLRHHVSTKMQEDKSTAREIVNHVLGHAPGSTMAQEVYRHIREKAAREALTRVEVKPAPPRLVASIEDPAPKKPNVVAMGNNILDTPTCQAHDGGEI